MSRLFRPLHSLVGSTRLISRLPSGQTVRVERVKVKRGKPATRFLGNVLKGALVFQLVVSTLSPLVDDIDDDDDLVPGEDEENDEPLFVPFPFTTKKLPRQPYSGSDPEWIEFIRISKDERLRDAIIKHTCKIVLGRAQRTPLLSQRLGKPTSVRRCWLDFDYPFYAPPEYERSGILVTDEAIEWTTMRCDPYLVKYLNRVLWPQPMALGIWALGKEAAKQTASDVARYFGFALEDPTRPQTRPAGPSSNPPPLPTSPGPEMQKALERIRQQTTRRPAEVNDPSAAASSSAAAAPAPTPTAPQDKAVDAPSKPNLDQSNSPDLPSPRGWFRELVFSIKKSRPWKTFQESFFREWQPLRPDPPRGSVLLSGVIELETPRAWIVVDTWAWYCPATNSIDTDSMRLVLRRIQHKVQKPLG
ncbi:901bb8c6-2569-4447-ae21-f6fe5e5549f9 [Thermothielavioides terrestris]|uniref:Uncharacterized protein n=2 Tax=Thermothielavioides terrestris TaxID=2587410 RepID=G2RCM1_THETT|nr:uncharacterized protein THITE_2096933 [Thermothielavioides terrestris NRRL 8126]AEO69812.1 hypothetical protein THITE_2096933 [Thermothielavioides terrestris NRRL 8126]SPQ17609.1 901bb8c6-2569-4447-ae21-f6fe5e5549f9 [Thermothielavioides terrestris]